MHYSLRTLIITTFLLIFFNVGQFKLNNLSAQDTDIIRIHVEIENSDSNLILDAQNTISMSLSELEQIGFQIEYVEEQSDANIGFVILESPPESSHYFGSSDHYFRIDIFTPETLSLSPILYAQSDLPIELLWDQRINETVPNPERIQRIIITLATYSIGDCDYWIDFTLEEVYGLPQRHALGFYYGNCQVMGENYEDALEALRLGASPAPGGGAVITSKHAAVNFVWTHLQYSESTVDEARIDYLMDYLFNCGYALTCNGLRNEVDLAILLSRRAQLYALDFNYDAAIHDIDLAIQRAEDSELDNSTLAELYTIRGEIIFLIYEWDRVEDNFNMAIEIDPSYAPAYFQRGVLFYTMARREDALADFETYLELDEDSIYAEQAQSYIESIQIELDALDG